MIINYATWLRWRIAEYAATSRYHIYIFTTRERRKICKNIRRFHFFDFDFSHVCGLCVCCGMYIGIGTADSCNPRCSAIPDPTVNSVGSFSTVNLLPSTWSFKTTTSTLHNCTNLPRIFKIVDGDSPEVKLPFWTCDRYQSLLSLITFRACKKDFDNSIRCLNS